MKFGIDRLIAEPSLRAPLSGRRVALLAHPASVTADLTHSLDALAACGDMKITAAFGPQHGLRGDKQDNMIELPDFNDPVHGIPVFSLYGEVRKPTDAMMDTCDVILVDLQDLGCRIYTFITTLRYRPRSGVETSQSGVGAGSAQSCWPAGRRLDAARRLAKLCRRRAVADAPRADARRAGSVVYQNAQARCRISRHRDAGLAARCRAGIRLAARRARVDQSQPQRAEFMDGARLCGHGDGRGHDALGRAAAPRGRSNCSARPISMRGRS